MNTAAARRRLLISMAHRRQRPGSGSGRDYLIRRTTQLKFPDLTPILGTILWCAVGAAATRLYMPERMTDDLDILVHSEDSQDAQERLTNANYVYQGGLSIGGSRWLSPENFPIDLLYGDENWVKAALLEAQTNRDGQGIPILPLPYLVLMKFNASRVQDIADISRMLGQATEPQLASVRAVFKRWLPGNDEDLDSLIALGQLEFGSA